MVRCGMEEGDIVLANGWRGVKTKPLHGVGVAWM